MSMISRIILSLCLIIFNILNLVDAASFDAEKFFQPSDINLAQLSPNGKLTIAISTEQGAQQLVLINNLTRKRSVIMTPSDFSEDESTIRNLTWIDDDKIATEFSEIRKGIGDLVDTKLRTNLLILKISTNDMKLEEVKAVKTSGRLVDALPDEKNLFLYSKQSHSSKIYQIDYNKLNKYKQKRSKLMRVDGGQFVKKNEVLSTSGYALYWYLGNKKLPTAVFTVEENKFILKKREENSEFSTIKEWTMEDTESDEDTKLLLPVRIADEENSFYCFDFNEDGHRSVFKVNYKKESSTLVYESPSHNIVDLIVDRDNKLTGIKVVKNGEISSEYLNAEQANSKKASKVIDSVINESIDQQYSLIYQESHSAPGKYYWKNNKTNKKTHIGSAYPHLDKKLDNSLIEGRLTVSGLEIPYLLTLPKTKKGTKLPLIVMPHGGPIGIFDHRYFDLPTQFFASQNYAVLRVNFRGSSGYTRELKDAGKKQWGDLMLEDIYQVTKAVSKRSDIDEKKISIFGMSYGGYAATMLTIKHPELFNCAVNMAGVNDLGLYLNQTGRNEEQFEWLVEHVGDPNKNYQEIKSISPVYQSDRLKRPLLIIHGEKDEVVDVEHAYRLKLMLEKHKKPFEWQIFPELDHSFGDTQTMVKVFSRIIEFIKNNS